MGSEPNGSPNGSPSRISCHFKHEREVENLGTIEWAVRDSNPRRPARHSVPATPAGRLRTPNPLVSMGSRSAAVRRRPEGIADFGYPFGYPSSNPVRVQAGLMSPASASVSHVHRGLGDRTVASAAELRSGSQ